MSVVERQAETPSFAFPVDLGWRNVVFSLRTALAAVLALAIAYWLELSDPQWATLTVYLLAQPTVGAALAKSAWRTVGTITGGILGLVVVGLFSQAAELVVAATVTLVGITFYVGARLRNYTAYGALLAGYSLLLVAYEGSSDPLNAWQIAADRTAEILIGIACSTLASAIIVPRYAGDALREAIAHTFSGLAQYIATALRLSTSLATFAALRRKMVADVVSFDALRSYAMFEAPEMRANEQALVRTVREFLMALSIARGLFIRLDEFDERRAPMVMAELKPALAAAATRVEHLASDAEGWRDPRGLRRELLAIRVGLQEKSAELEAMAGRAPVDELANGVLVLRRSGDLLRSLSRVIVAEAASVRPARATTAVRRQVRHLELSARREALWIAIRAAIALTLMSGLWLATGWDEGFTAVSGGSIMLFFAVNQDHPQTTALSFLTWSAVGIVVAYAVMVLVLPYLEGFEALALVLVLVLLPAGLMAGTPSRAWAGIALGGFTVANIGTDNVFAPNELAFINASAALLIGMVLCLAVIAALPVNSHARRGQSWERTFGVLLPAVARGELRARQASSEIVTVLSALLPRLSLDRAGEDDFFRGSLGAASFAIELGRLRRLIADPATPPEIVRELEAFLDKLAPALQALGRSRAGNRLERMADAERIVDDAKAALTSRQLEPGTALAQAVLRAGASLRFMADRFIIDRAYLERRFSES